MKSKVSKISIRLITVIIIILTLWFTGIIGLWINGMPYITYNTKKFDNRAGYIISGDYSVSINLNDLQSNIGKELYNDGSNKIYVSCIDNTGNSSTGGYRIVFRSCGQYSLISATLVSGVRHVANDDNSFTDYMTANMNAKYNGKIYKSAVFSTGGLNYKDGDDFSFYVFPYYSYSKGEVSLTEKGIVELMITNLYKNIWTKS